MLLNDEKPSGSNASQVASFTGYEHVEVGFNEYMEGAAAGSNEDRKEVTKKGHGGWMPQCVKLCQAYNKGKRWTVEQLITDFQYSSTVFASMLNRGVKDD